MPQPTTTGGGLMGYPTTVDTGGVVPQMIGPDWTELNTSAFTALTAGKAYFSPFSLLTGVTITQLRCQFSGAPTGNVDMGVFDATGTNGAPGNMLGHTGVNVAATGVFTKSLTANLLLSPGAYWLAWLDTVADTVARSANANSGMVPALTSTSSVLTVLASSIATQDTTNKVVMVALLSGGYS